MRASVPMVTLLLLGGSAGAFAQTADRLFFRPATEPFSLDVEAGGIFNTNIDQDPTNLHSQGLVARLIFEARKPAGNRVLLFRYIGDVQSHTKSDRYDRGSSNATAVYYQSLTPELSLTAVGGYSQRGPTAQQVPANQYSGWSQLRYRPSSAAEVGFFGSYRWVRPDDATRNENVLVAGVDLGGDLGRSSVWEIGYQRERSDSPTFGRAYQVGRFHAEYAWRMGQRTSLGLRLDHEKWLYTEWSFTAGDAELASRESLWLPSAFLVHRFDSGKRITIQWELQDRSTNYGWGAFRGQRLSALFRVPIVGGSGASTRRPGDGLPLPKLPDDVPTPDPPILDQLTYLAAAAQFAPERQAAPEETLTFTRGSHWKEVLAAQGVPSGVSEKPQLFQELWLYGSSWVTFNGGRVVSWHDAGNLKLRPEPREKEAPPAPRPLRSDEPAPELAKIENTDETITSAFLRMAEPEIVLADGRRLKGVLRKYENGLAHVLLFLENDRTLFATLPENLIDKEATGPIPLEPSEAAGRAGVVGDARLRR